MEILKKLPVGAFSHLYFLPECLNLLNARLKFAKCRFSYIRSHTSIFWASGAWAPAFTRIVLSEPFQKRLPLLDIPHYYILFTKGQKDYSRLMHFIWTLHLCKPSHLSKQSPVKAKLPNLQPDGFPTQDKVENYRLSWARSLPSLSLFPSSGLAQRWRRGNRFPFFLDGERDEYVKQEWLY